MVTEPQPLVSLKDELTLRVERLQRRADARPPADTLSEEDPHVISVCRSRPPAFTRTINPKVDVAISEWVETNGQPFLILSGPTGCGKTAAAWVALEKLAELRAGFRFVEQWFAVVAAYDLEAAQADVMRRPVLVLDDLGAENTATAHAAGRINETVLRVINHRWEQCLTTVITTNMGGVNVPGWLDGAPEDTTIAGRYGARVWDRLRAARVVSIAGTSWRAAHPTARHGDTARR